jgi:hypothetical protein
VYVQTKAASVQLFHTHRQQTSRRNMRIYPINLMSQYSSHLGQVRNYKHVKPQQDSQHLKAIIHHDKCAPPSAVIISGVPRGTCSVPSLSFRATLFCSKLRMPSRPHRDIITLSCEIKVESTLHVIRRTLPHPKENLCKTQPVFNFIECQNGLQLTGCRQHIVTCKHSIRSSHETHCLLVLA